MQPNDWIEEIRSRLELGLPSPLNVVCVHRASRRHVISVGNRVGHSGQFHTNFRYPSDRRHPEDQRVRRVRRPGHTRWQLHALIREDQPLDVSQKVRPVALFAQVCYAKKSSRRILLQQVVHAIAREECAVRILVRWILVDDPPGDRDVAGVDVTGKNRLEELFHTREHLFPNLETDLKCGISINDVVSSLADEEIAAPSTNHDVTAVPAELSLSSHWIGGQISPFGFRH